MEHQQQYVGIDLQRRRSVIVRMTGEGEVLEVVRIVNDPVALSLELAKAGPDPEVALEATYGWYWAADLLEADVAGVHLVHPLGLHWDARRVKNDERDATELAHRLRRGISRSPDRAGGGAPPAGADPLSSPAGGAAHVGQGADPRGDGRGSWWRTDDLWFWALQALVTYLRAATEHSAEPVTAICGRVASPTASSSHRRPDPARQNAGLEGAQNTRPRRRRTHAEPAIWHGSTASTGGDRFGDVSDNPSRPGR